MSVVSAMMEESHVGVISRNEWGARTPSGPVPVRQYKADRITFSFNTNSEPCDTKEECIKRCQEIQRREMDEEGLTDISYNFLIGNDGNVYEGRGYFNMAAFTRRYPPTEFPNQTLDIAFIGNYEAPKGYPWPMMKLAVKFINNSVAKDMIPRNYNVADVTQFSTPA